MMWYIVKALFELDSIDLGEVISKLADGFAVFIDFGEVAMSKHTFRPL